MLLPLRSTAVAALIALAPPATGLARAEEPAAVAHDLARARALRIVGAILATVGGAAALATALVGVTASQRCPGIGEQCAATAGGSMLGLGLVAATHLAVGIPLGGIGVLRAREARRRLALAVTPVANPEGGGLLIALSF